jgi:tetrahydromethanopterin S-methyltransferase subunit G
MAAEPDSLILRFLRNMDQKLDRMAVDVDDMKGRSTGVERGLAGVEMSIAGVQHRIDRVEQRLDRIERRLDLVDGPFGGVRE